jgi:hypothetical protein
MVNNVYNEWSTMLIPLSRPFQFFFQVWNLPLYQPILTSAAPSAIAPPTIPKQADTVRGGAELVDLPRLVLPSSPFTVNPMWPLLVASTAGLIVAVLYVRRPAVVENVVADSSDEPNEDWVRKTSAKPGAATLTGHTLLLHVMVFTVSVPCGRPSVWK